MNDSLRKTTPLVLLALFVAAALLPAAIAASGRDYWRPDEPDYAQHAREMVQRLDFVVPYQNGEPFPEKPILTYWAVALTTPFTGGDVTPFGSRVPSLLGGALLVLVAIRAAGWLGAVRDRWLAGAAMAVAPIAFWQAQFLQMDALFSGLLAGALLVQLKLENDEAPRPWLAFGGHVLLGLAVLTKGPLALAVSVLVGGGSVLATRSFRPVKVLYPFRAALVVTVVAAPWYVLAIRRFGWDYAYELIIRHNFVRFAAAWDHIHPFWYYAVEKIWADFFPWTLPALLAVVFLWKRGEVSKNPRLGSVLRAVGISLLLLSISRSKQGKYLLFLYPFVAAVFALLVARLRTAEDGAASRARTAVRAVLAVLAVVLVAAALALHPVATRKVPADAGLVPWIAVPLGLGAVAALVLLARRRREIAPAVFALAGGLWLAQAALGAKGLPAMNERKTARPLYERLKPAVSNGEPLAYASSRFRCYALTVLDRRVEWIKTPEALLAWLEKHPDGWVFTGKAEFDTWLAGTPALKALVLRDSATEGSDTGLVLRLPQPEPGAPDPADVTAGYAAGMSVETPTTLHLLALHAFPLDGRMWGAVRAASVSGQLGEGLAVLAPDFRGRGKSGLPAEPVHAMSLLAGDVLAQLPPEGPFVVMGLSMGGYVALELLARLGPRLRPRLKGLVLCDSRANADDDAGKAKRAATAASIESDGMEPVLAAMLPQLLIPSSRGRALEQLVRTMLLATPPGAAAADQRGMAERADHSDVLGTLAVPFLAAVGEEDVLTPPSASEQMVEAAGNAPYVELLTLPGAHLAPLEHPEEFLPRLRAFLDRCRG